MIEITSTPQVAKQQKALVYIFFMHSRHMNARPLEQSRNHYKLRNTFPIDRGIHDNIRNMIYDNPKITAKTGIAGSRFKRFQMQSQVQFQPLKDLFQTPVLFWRLRQLPLRSLTLSASLHYDTQNCVPNKVEY